MTAPRLMLKVSWGGSALDADPRPMDVVGEAVLRRCAPDARPRITGLSLAHLVDGVDPAHISAHTIEPDQTQEAVLRLAAEACLKAERHAACFEVRQTFALVLYEKREQVIEQVRFVVGGQAKDRPGGSVELELTEATEFVVADAGDVRISGRAILSPPKPDERKLLADLVARARRGEVATLPIAWSTDHVVLDGGAKVIKTTGGLIGPGEGACLGPIANFRCLVVGLEVLEGAEHFEVRSFSVARQSVISEDIPASAFVGDWLQRAPLDGGVLPAGCVAFVTVRNASKRPQAIRGLLHVVDLVDQLP